MVKASAGEITAPLPPQYSSKLNDLIGRMLKVNEDDRIDFAQIGQIPEISKMISRLIET